MSRKQQQSNKRKQRSLDEVMMQTAWSFASLSLCSRLKVGAVLTRNNRILCCGYNGTIPGTPNECEEDGVTSPFVLHAEQNVLTYCAKNGIPTDNSTLYITHSPCPDCAKLLAAAGITEVIYNITFRDPSGILFLNTINIPTQRFSNVV